MERSLVDDLIVKILCTACNGKNRAGVLTGHEVVVGQYELDEQAHWVCQRCKAHPGIDPDMIFTDRGGNLWIDRIPLEEQ